MAYPIFPPDSSSDTLDPNAVGYRSKREPVSKSVGSSVVYFMNGEFPSSSMLEERGTIDPEIRAADAVRTTHDPVTGPVLLYVTLASAKNCVFSRRTGALRPAIGVITPRPVFTKNLPSLFATLAFPPHQHHLRDSLKNTENTAPPFPSYLKLPLSSTCKNFLTEY